jgi:hypothetical protein
MHDLAKSLSVASLILALAACGDNPPAYEEPPPPLDGPAVTDAPTDAPDVVPEPDAGGLAPVVRIVSPLNGATVAAGRARVGVAGPTYEGSGFALNVEIVTRDGVGVKAREANSPAGMFGIRHVTELEQGAPNPDFPGLTVEFDQDLVTPSGTILPAFNNFAAAFNVLGTDDTP